MDRLSAYWTNKRIERKERERARRQMIEVEEDRNRMLQQLTPLVQNMDVAGAPVTRTYIKRNREDKHVELMADYFNPDPRFPPHFFRRRFRMRRELFLRLLHAVSEANPYFRQQRDCTGRLGLSPVQKVMAVVLVLAYGYCFDNVAELIKIGEKTAKDSTIKFCDTVITLFKEQYLRDPTPDDLARLLEENSKRGFPGMIGSLDCMHWRWDSCPQGRRGQYNGRSGHPTVVLEAVASYDLWIWHAFFGMHGTNNDIIVLDHSTLFKRHLNGLAPPVQYEVNGNQYNLPYYLTDEIYMKHDVLIQGVKNPISYKERTFTMKQESRQKDIEKAFDVLQQKWHILHIPARLEKLNDLLRVMLTCLILHNMIVEDECGQDLPEWIQPNEDEQSMPDIVESIEEISMLMSARLGRIHNRRTNERLQRDLIDHVWMCYGDEDEERVINLYFYVSLLSLLLVVPCLLLWVILIILQCSNINVCV